MTEQAEGLLGSCARVPESGLYLHNQRLGLVSTDPEEIIKDYVYHLFKTKSVREQIRLSSSGSKVKHTSPERIYDVKAPLPSVAKQLRIIEVLDSIEEKIELNNKINAELEAMAKLIYDYWFVQFDFPDANGKPYKSSGGKMVYNETLKREIPDGWEDKELAQIANITMGQSPNGSSYNETGDGLVFFQGSTDFGYRFPSVRQYTTEPSRLAKSGDILLSVRAPVGTLNVADKDCCIGRGLTALSSKDNADSFLFYVMLYFKQIFDRRNASGTTFGSITKDDLFSLKLVYPSKGVLRDYDGKVSVFNKKIFNNHQQNKELIKLRDWLLPMLMNGQVTVKDS
ncbi:MAG: restriction endonuclease subunit S [Candidatus Thiodiazotropha sp. (ex Cardiolucina cf. quadrata)]|nr:restriction endonuclease subunit S [Candidatus Thiodiazotropha sp. (ex Cardiolucina cf. quadrata)]